MHDFSAECRKITSFALERVMPEAAVRRALDGFVFPDNKLVLIAAGKAAWRMANAAYQALGDRIDDGLVITKYGHSQGPIGHLTVGEAGHPVPDEQTLVFTRRALEMTSCLTAHDTVLFLLSGGGSALFEDPLIPLEQLQCITGELLKNGADIASINAVRKCFSRVKGGKFALHCAPALVKTVILSDVLGDDPAVIASGPTVPDQGYAEKARKAIRDFDIELPEGAEKFLTEPASTAITTDLTVTGSVRELCSSAAEECGRLGYEATVLTDCADGEAREVGRMLASIARTHRDTDRPLAFLIGGETVVHVKGHGLGGRNQEIALSAAIGLENMENAAVFSLGSDGTDGPTDAAGGFVDGMTVKKMRAAGISPEDALNDNDAYHALAAVEGLLVTGPTGTNVNDVSVLLIRPKQEN